ncbi:hypothetical protein FE257_012663 [Aspergillus nanangensis]|uniref:Zn(2)-C6 fungal-type domain-containing protein n=1 Tax=Aspergillus nanangensis TaxID=2582783 RepID=A0AAD4CFQ3_ASPNN|nr:hypothetical protein FE257_012663 [Aspergillus nanangensis]
MSLIMKRAPRACTWCHERKVRCDASTFGRPCTRCRQEGHSCMIRKRILSRPRHSTFPPEKHSRLNAANPAPPDEKKVGDLPHAVQKNHVTFSSYPFLELKGFSGLVPEDVAFLSAKGCLEIPERALLDEFVRQYFLHVHPCMPLIDEAVFWKYYREGPQGTEAPRLSLLFFQALLFASSPYISLQTAQDCGFEDIRAGWNTLYQRAKDDPQCASLWLAHAIQAATTAAFQLTSKVHMEELAQSRLWWSILVRDRSICLGVRRRPQVLSFELRMMADLPNEESFQAEIHGSQVYDSTTKRMLFTVFREQCQLAALLTEMVLVVFGNQGLSVPILTHEGFQDRLAVINKIRISLLLWEKSSSISHCASKNVHNAVIKFTHLTMMYYQASRMELAHYEASLLETHSEFVGINYVRQLSHTGNMLYDAMTRLVSILDYFRQKGKSQNLPLTIVGYVTMPLVLSAINFKLSSSEIEMDARRQSMECLGELMSHSRRAYKVSEFISTQTDNILRLAYLTSQQIFLRQDADFRLQRRSSPSLQSPRTNVDTKYVKPPLHVSNRRVNNWHDAFLQNPRAYLLISTTVDYFMSVGRLPQNSALPEFVCTLSPWGKIRLPWSSEKVQLGRENHQEQPDRSETGAMPQSSVWTTSSNTRKNEQRQLDPSIPDCTSRLSSDEWLHDEVILSGHEHRIDNHQDQQNNIGYFPLRQVFNGSPLLEPPAHVASAQFPQFDSEMARENTREKAETWELTEVAVPYDEFMNSLVHDCFG